MKAERLTRVNELLRREIGLQLFHALDPSEVDLSTVTVTHVMIGADLRAARVLISVRSTPEIQNHTLYQLRHRHGAIQRLVAEHVILKYTPRLNFFLDDSLREGDHVLQILNDMEGTALLPQNPVGFGQSGAGVPPAYWENKLEACSAFGIQPNFAVIGTASDTPSSDDPLTS